MCRRKRVGEMFYWKSWWESEIVALSEDAMIIIVYILSSLIWHPFTLSDLRVCFRIMINLSNSFIYILWKDGFLYFKCSRVFRQIDCDLAIIR